MRLTEPPSCHPFRSIEHVLAMSHAGAEPHVVVIGRDALPAVLALLRHGCPSVRSLRPDAAAPDCERADLAWILDVESERELDDALRAAHRRAPLIVLEGTACRFCRELPRYAERAGLDVVSFDHVSQRVMLAPHTALAMAA